MSREGVISMQNRLLRSIGRFFEGTGGFVSTPSGDARGHMHPSTVSSAARRSTT